MRVIYELNNDDIRKLISEKYEVAPDKIVFHMTQEILINVDMSTTEVSTAAPDSSEDIPIPVPADPVLAAVPKMSYESLTDDILAKLLSEGKTVAEICRMYGFDQTIKYRLYKRTEKIRSECASFSKRR